MIDLRADFLATLKRLLAEIVPGCEVRVFGSRYKWTATDASDLDLVLAGPCKLPWKTLAKLKAALEESALPMRVDVLDWQAISPEFRKVIEAGYEVIQKRGLGMSSRGWNAHRIGDIGKIVTGKTPPTQNPSNFGDKYPFITPRDMLGQKRIHQTERYLSEEGKNSVKNSLLPVNSICVSCIGSDMGKVVMTTKDSVTNQQLNSVICGDSFDPDFVYYALVNISDELRNVGHHSTAVPILNKTDFSNFEIIAPDLPTQHHIAAILSALDDKIELNRQTNATLEQIAQAIFKEWFVEFRYPGATGEMVESELGRIPTGWRVGKLGEVCKNIRKTVHPRELASDTAYVGLEHIPRKSLGLISWGVSQDVDSQKTHFKKYDVLFGRLRPYFHKVCVAPLDGICSIDILVIKPHNGDFFSFCLNHLFSNELITYVSAIADGTRMPRVDWNSISNYEIIMPPGDLVSQFNKITFPFYDEIIENNQQSTAFAQLRDLLLPKLMNGEIDVVGAYCNTPLRSQQPR